MYSILFVCSGNQCRSPYAQVALSKYAPGWVTVASAGTLGIEGVSPPADLVSVAGGRDLDLSASLSRPIKGAGAGEADLVIGMTLDHVAAAVVNGGADATKTFTLAELVRLLESDELEAPRTEAEATQLVEQLHALRTESKSFVPDEDIEDPIGRPKRAYEEMADKLDELIARFARALGWS